MDKLNKLERLIIEDIKHFKSLQDNYIKMFYIKNHDYENKIDTLEEVLKMICLLKI